MTKEDQKIMHQHFQHGLTTLLDKTMQVLSAKQSWTLDEMGKVTDMLKDLSEVQKNCMKVSSMSGSVVEETF